MGGPKGNDETKKGPKRAARLPSLAGRKKLLPLIFSPLIGLAAGLLVFWLWNQGYIYGLELVSQDLRFGLRGTRKAPDDVVLVTWDDQTFVEMGHRYQDWPRSLHARVIENLAEMGAKVIVFDIIIENPSESILSKLCEGRSYELHLQLLPPQISDNVADFCEEVMAATQEDPKEEDDREEGPALPSVEDLAVVEAIKKARKLGTTVILDAFFSSDETEFGVMQTYHTPMWEFEEAGATSAFVNVEPDVDGFLRRMLAANYYNDEWFFALPLVAVAYYEGLSPEELSVEGKEVRVGSHRLPLYGSEGGERLLVNYYAPTGKSFTRLPYYQVAQAEKYKNIAEKIKGKLVYVGIYTETLGQDVYPVPFTRFDGRRMPGVEVLASTTSMILQDRYLHELPDSALIVLLLVVGPLGGFLFARFGFLPGAAVTLACVVGYSVVAKLLFDRQGLFVHYVPVILTFLLSYGGVILYRGLTEEKEKRRIRSTFSRYVTASVVEEVLNNPEAAALGGKRKEVTIFFSDIRGFTSISESLPPEEVVSLLNEYLTEMTNIVFKYEGTLDKYIGDAVMAIWGAPAAHEDDPERAVRASLEMVEKVKEINARWIAQKRPTTFQIGAGLNTGEVVVGNIGSEERRDYTVIGDHVNLASRLEGVTKLYGARIVASESTYDRTKEKFYYRPLDIVAVKGKQTGIRIFEVMGAKDNSTDPAWIELAQLSSQGFEAYLKQQWDEALRIFREIQAKFPEDKLAPLYIERCEAFKQNPPGPDWDGIARLTTK